jgi:hypothetical protein
MEQNKTELAQLQVPLGPNLLRALPLLLLRCPLKNGGCLKREQRTHTKAVAGWLTEERNAN